MCEWCWIEDLELRRLDVFHGPFCRRLQWANRRGPPPPPHPPPHPAPPGAAPAAPAPAPLLALTDLSIPVKSPPTTAPLPAGLRAAPPKQRLPPGKAPTPLPPALQQQPKQQSTLQSPPPKEGTEAAAAAERNEVARSVFDPFAMACCSVGPAEPIAAGDAHGGDAAAPQAHAAAGDGQGGDAAMTRDAATDTTQDALEEAAGFTKRACKQQ